jgi:hypothetical protein
MRGIVREAAGRAKRAAAGIAGGGYSDRGEAEFVRDGGIDVTIYCTYYYSDFCNPQ